MKTKTIRQNDIQRQLALACHKGLIDIRGKITDKAMKQAMDAIAAYAARNAAKADSK